MQQETLIEEVIIAIIATGILAICTYIIKCLYKLVLSATNSFTQNSLHKISIFTYLIYLIVLGCLYNNEIFSSETILLSISIASICNIIFLYNYIFKLRKIGIVGSDLSIVSGFNYLQSIKSSKKDFRFLGVGARKLTSYEPNFEKLVERVSKNGNHVRLLLCHPDSEALTHLATRAYKSPNDYSHKVRSSLKYLAKLVIEKGYEIDIRFYHSENVHDMPIFRLVFIDSLYCLTSYTQFNDSKHEGELMPQIHFANNTNKDNSNSFYFGFETYFERLWNKNESKKWRPNDFI